VVDTVVQKEGHKTPSSFATVLSVGVPFVARRGGGRDLSCWGGDGSIFLVSGGFASPSWRSREEVVRGTRNRVAEGGGQDSCRFVLRVHRLVKGGWRHGGEVAPLFPPAPPPFRRWEETIDEREPPAPRRRQVNQEVVVEGVDG